MQAGYLYRLMRVSSWTLRERAVLCEAVTLIEGFGGGVTWEKRGRDACGIFGWRVERGMRSHRGKWGGEGF